MTREERHRYEMFTRVFEFCQREDTRFRAAPVASEAIAVLERRLPEIERLWTAELANANAGRRLRPMTRSSLRSALTTIARTSRAIAIREGRSDLHLRMPGSTGDRALLDAAGRFAAAALANDAAFMAAGMPPTFLLDLQTSVDHVNAALSLTRDGRAACKAARLSVARAVTACFGAIRQLDSVAPNLFADDKPEFAMWQHARKLRGIKSRKARRLRKEARERAAATSPSAPTSDPPRP